MIALFRELARGGPARHRLEPHPARGRPDLRPGGAAQRRLRRGRGRDRGRARRDGGAAPVQVLIRCDRPSLLASRVFEQDHVVEARIHDDGRGLLVRTRDADRFYLLLNRVVLDERPRRRGGGAGRRRRPRRLPVPDRLEWREVVSEIVTPSAAVPRAAAPRLPWGLWWRQVAGRPAAGAAQELPRPARLGLLPAGARCRSSSSPLRALIPDAVDDPGERRRGDRVLRRASTRPSSCGW